MGYLTRNTGFMRAVGDTHEWLRPGAQLIPGMSELARNAYIADNQKLWRQRRLAITGSPGPGRRLWSGGRAGSCSVQARAGEAGDGDFEAKGARV
jgi:hypothetical protein